MKRICKMGQDVCNYESVGAKLNACVNNTIRVVKINLVEITKS